MAQLGSSPLGLVMNTSVSSQPKIGSYVLGESDNGKRLFNSIFGRNGEEISTNQFDYTRDDPSLFEIKTQDIIEYCQRYPLMRLTYADFAYLKNLGVYPNNRLIIARRFAAPVGDDLINNIDNNTYPLSTLISWVPDNEDFLDVSFGENWTDGETTFKTLLDEASKNRDVLGGDNAGAPLGTILSEGANSAPLPGWSEGLQYALFKQLGLTDLNANDLPFGNPNLIRSSKRRNTADKDGSFAGVKAKISIKMKIEYEQKFISGIDPTGVYFDIIANALSFGTSVSKFMFKPEALGANNKFALFLNNLGSGDINRVGEALSAFVSAISEALLNVASTIAKTVSGLWEGKAKETQEKEKADKDKGLLKTAAEFTSDATSAVAKALGQLISNIIAGVISKYKVRIISVLNSLTGSPSTPWHVTIGNPKRPIFSSGDMLVDTVDVKFGKLLAYNDLPSSITLQVTLTNARDLGSQEIYRKLNCGRERTFKVIRKDILSVDGELNIKGLTAGQIETRIKEDLAKQDLAIDATQGAPIDNSGNANQNKPGVGNVNLECFKNYNFILDEIAKVLILKDAYRADGTPLLKKWKLFNDSEIGAENSVKNELVKIVFKPQREAVAKCPQVKTLLEANLEKIYKGILNQTDGLQIDYYDPATISTPVPKLIKKSFDCDF